MAIYANESGTVKKLTEDVTDVTTNSDAYPTVLLFDTEKVHGSTTRCKALLHYTNPWKVAVIYYLPYNRTSSSGLCSNVQKYFVESDNIAAGDKWIINDEFVVCKDGFHLLRTETNINSVYMVLLCNYGNTDTVFGYV